MLTPGQSSAAFAAAGLRTPAPWISKAKARLAAATWKGEAGGGPRGNPAGGDPIHHFPQGRHGSGGELACLPVGEPAPGGAGPAAPDVAAPLDSS